MSTGLRTNQILQGFETVITALEKSPGVPRFPHVEVMASLDAGLATPPQQWPAAIIFEEGWRTDDSDNVEHVIHDISVAIFHQIPMDHRRQEQLLGDDGIYALEEVIFAALDYSTSLNTTFVAYATIGSGNLTLEHPDMPHGSGAVRQLRFKVRPR